MENVESQILAYIQRRPMEGALSVPASEVMDAIIPAEHPEYRLRPAYRYGLERLRRRSVVNAIVDEKGVEHFFIGNFASDELRKSLGL
jgi:hypothetical protein